MLELSVRETIGRGTPVSFNVSYSDQRLSDHVAQYWAHMRVLVNGADARIRLHPDQPVQTFQTRRNEFRLDHASRTSFGFGRTLEPLGDEEPADSVLRVQVAITRSPGSVVHWSEPHEMPDEEVRWVTLEKRVRVVQGDGITRTHEGEPPIIIRDDVVLEPPLRLSGGANRDGVFRYWVTLTTQGLTMQVAHRVVLVSPDGTEREIASLHKRVDSSYDVRPDKMMGSVGSFGNGISFEYDSVGRIPQGTAALLRPDPSIASNSTYITELDMRAIDLGEIEVPE